MSYDAIDERLDYKFINKVLEQWGKRFTS